MPVCHFTPDTNSKKELTKDDPAGWYQITVAQRHTLAAMVLWWDGYKWSHSPNTRSGWKSLDSTDRDVRGIVRLVEA